MTARREDEDMIELKRNVEYSDIQVWADEDFSHVITEDTKDSSAPGWYVVDKGRQYGPYAELAHAFTAAELMWVEVTLAPANRLRAEIEDGDENDGMQYLLEYLATYGTAGIDAQALAQRVFERIEED